jgi:predicted MFS family arabinose efflux permease
LTPRPGGKHLTLDIPERRRDWLLLALATIAFGLGFGINAGTWPSFAVEFLGIRREELGLLESLREVPGLLTAAIIGVLAFIAEPRLALLALVLLGLGFGLTGQVRSFWPLVACNVLWSIGLHIWLTVQPSLTLTLSQEGRHGYGLGLMNRYFALAVMAGLLFVRFFAQPLGYGATFILAGVAAAAGGIFVARIPRTRGAGLGQRLVFRPRYWRYYALMLLDGGRRQVVQTFAVLILIREFAVGIETVALLLLVNNALTMAAAPVVGRWTDRFGERRVLSLYYGLVAAVFFAYTRIEWAAAGTGFRPEHLFFVLFALDNLLFTASVGIQTYIRHTAPAEELSPSLAMGLTWNHVAAVTVPLAAGWIWARYGYAQIFACGVVLAVTSMLTCLTLPRRAAGAGAPWATGGPPAGREA